MITFSFLPVYLLFCSSYQDFYRLSLDHGTELIYVPTKIPSNPNRLYRRA